jgi:DNA-binding MarR family transcriptional regulator
VYYSELVNDSAAVSESATERRALVGSIADRLIATYARRHRARESRLARQGVSMTHFHAMVQLADAPMTMSELARALGASLSSMSGIVDRIEARGLIERERSGDDRRVVRVHLTPAGRDWLCEMESMRRDRIERVLGHLDDERLVRLSAALDDLLGAFAAVDAAEASSHDQKTEDVPTPGAASTETEQREQVTA